MSPSHNSIAIIQNVCPNSGCCTLRKSYCDLITAAIKHQLARLQLSYNVLYAGSTPGVPLGFPFPPVLRPNEVPLTHSRGYPFLSHGYNCAPAIVQKGFRSPSYRLRTLSFSWFDCICFVAPLFQSRSEIGDVFFLFGSEI